MKSPSPILAKRAKFDKLQSPPSDKDRKPDWLQSMSKSAHKDLKQVQLKQRPSAFRPWSPKAVEKEKPVPHKEAERPNNRNRETLVSPPLHPNDSHVSGSKNISIKEPHNSKPTHSMCSGQAEDMDMDTDGEIDVDDCDDGPVPASSLTSPPAAYGGVSQSLSPQRPPQTQDLAPWQSGPVGPEIETMRQMLYAGMETREAREKVLQEIVRMRVKQEEKLAAALQAKRSLQQELEFVRVAKKGRLRDAIEAKRNLRKEIERLRVDWERKMRDAEESCGRLKRELDRERQVRVCDQGCEAERLRVKYSTQIEELHVQLQQAEADREQLRQELQQEREARQSLESVVKDLQNQLALQASSSPPGESKDAHKDTKSQATQSSRGS